MEHAVEGLGSPALGRGHTYSTGKQTSSGFGAVLQQELARADERQIAFSKHAIARAEERGIAVTPALLDRLTDSVERARRISWRWTRASPLSSMSPTTG